MGHRDFAAQPAQLDMSLDQGLFSADAATGSPAVASEDVGAAIARELNGPLTALLLYMGEIKQHSDRISPPQGDRAYLQRVVDNALLQTERVCAVVKQLAISRPARHLPPPGAAAPVSMLASPQKPLTRREREVLRLISQGYSNKEGALHMRISPRTFESHRAEVMRKLGARNTADLVRAALLHALD
jgi:DNA-binding CsgD family transcriptional regulator